MRDKTRCQSFSERTHPVKAIAAVVASLSIDFLHRPPFSLGHPI